MEIVSGSLKELDEIRQKTTEYYADESRLHNLFREDIKKEYNTVDSPYEESIWEYAYKNGHASGYEEVASIYGELAFLFKWPPEKKNVKW